MISLDTLLAKNLLPDAAIRLGIRNLLARKLRDEDRGDVERQQRALLDFVRELKASPVAIKTAAANAQHYEVPTEFFRLVLGPRMKYSSGYWPSPTTTFADSEEAMLWLTCERAELVDGMDILELGCGW
ncbi:MAG: SAM-dependent methyltransferase, partial [Chthoniobacterales bacterium]